MLTKDNLGECKSCYRLIFQTRRLCRVRAYESKKKLYEIISTETGYTQYEVNSHIVSYKSAKPYFDYIVANMP
jgi:hypothetical protein